MSSRLFSIAPVAQVCFLLSACLVAASPAFGQTKAAKNKRLPLYLESEATTLPVREARPVGSDERIRTVAYNSNEVVYIRGAFGYAMVVEFSEEEAIQSVSLGDTIAWQVVPRKNLLFIKPQENKPETNMLVLTNKRIYTFNLQGFKPTGLSDQKLTYRVRFSYPEEELRKVEEASARSGALLDRDIRLVTGAETGALNQMSMPSSRARSPDQWNFAYSYKGSRISAPIQMLDDGEFTYIRFSDMDNVPAIFMVDYEKRETLVNYRREGQWLVVERIARQFTFRGMNNSEITCVFNDQFPARPQTSLRDLGR